MDGAEGKKLLLGLSVRGERRPCVLGGFLQRNQADKIFFCLEEINHEDLHTSMETDCPHSAGGRLETQGSWWQRSSSDTWENWWWKLQSESEADWCPCSKTVRQRDGILSYSAFHSVQTLNRMDVVHPHWRGLSALFSTLIQMLIPPRNILPDTLRIMFSWISGQMFNWISEHSMALSSCHVNVAIIPWMEHYTNLQKTGYCLFVQRKLTGEMKLHFSGLSWLICSYVQSSRGNREPCPLECFLGSHEWTHSPLPLLWCCLSLKVLWLL